MQSVNNSSHSHNAKMNRLERKDQKSSPLKQPETRGYLDSSSLGTDPTQGFDSKPKKQTSFEPSAASIQRMVEMGFNKKEAKEALKCFKGDEEKATELLLDNSEPMIGKKRRKQ